MPAALIDGKAIAEQVKGEVRARTDSLRASRGITPGLAFILVGENPASQVYVRSKGKACAELGFHSVTHELPAETRQEALLELIAGLNADPAVHGILVQLPLPPHINEQAVLEAIDFRKDVDGFHPVNVGRLVIGLDSLRPCTPAGIQEMLTRSGHDPSGRHVVVVGRSNIVGKPIANILLQKKSGANAVVTVAHTGARDLSRFTKEGDIVIAAVGKAGGGHRRDAEAGGGGDRRRHQPCPGCFRAEGEPVGRATWISPRPRRSPRPLHRSPAGSGR